MTDHSPTVADPIAAQTAERPSTTDGAADDGAHGHGATDGQYIVIAAILGVITAGEVALSYMDVGAIFIPTLLVLMAVKFLIVVSYFMHLKFDNKLFSFLFYAGLGLAVSVYVAALATFQFFGS